MLERMRTRKGWSQNRLAVEAGVDRSYITRLESGDRETPRPPIVKILADALCDDQEEAWLFQMMAGTSGEIGMLSDIVEHLIDHGEPLQKAVLALCRGWPIG